MKKIGNLAGCKTTGQSASPAADDTGCFADVGICLACVDTLLS